MRQLHLLTPDGKRLVIENERAIIGRDPSCDVQIPDPSVSRQHAAIEWADGVWTVSDLDSGNGLLLDGTPVKTLRLKSGQKLQLGRVILRVDDIVSDPVAPTFQAAPPAGAQVRPPGLPPPAARRGGAGTALALVGLGLLVGVVALVLYLRSARPAAPPDAPRPGALPEASAPPAQDTEAVPVSTARPGASFLLMQASARVEIILDSRPQPSLSAGEIRTFETTPGDHRLRWKSGAASGELVVRTNPDEQTLVRLPPARPSSTPRPAPTPRPTSTPRPTPRVSATRPAPTPRPTASAPPAGTPAQEHPATSELPDDARLRDGVAAVRRGDFYPAQILLRDTARRLEQAKAPSSDQALVQVYLAWAHNGLGRDADARAAAARAVSLDPSIARRVADLPPAVASLLRPQ